MGDEQSCLNRDTNLDTCFDSCPAGVSLYLFMCCTDGHHTPVDAAPNFPQKFTRHEELPANKEALRKGVHPGSFIDLLVCNAQRAYMWSLPELLQCTFAALARHSDSMQEGWT